MDPVTRLPQSFHPALLAYAVSCLDAARHPGAMKAPRNKTMRGFVRSFKAHPVLTVGSMMLGVFEFVALQRSQFVARVQQ